MITLSKSIRCKIGDRIYAGLQASDLRTLPGFTPSALVSIEGSDGWQPAFMIFDSNGQFSSVRCRDGVSLDPTIQAVLDDLIRKAHKPDPQIVVKNNFSRPVLEFKPLSRHFKKVLGLVLGLAGLGALIYSQGPALLDRIIASHLQKILVVTPQALAPSAPAVAVKPIAPLVLPPQLPAPTPFALHSHNYLRHHLKHKHRKHKHVVVS